MRVRRVCGRGAHMGGAQGIQWMTKLRSDHINSKHPDQTNAKVAGIAQAMSLSVAAEDGRTSIGQCMLARKGAS